MQICLVLIHKIIICQNLSFFYRKFSELDSFYRNCTEFVSFLQKIYINVSTCNRILFFKDVSCIF